MAQNAATHPTFLGYQGALTLYGATSMTGSTVVCPASHKDFVDNCRRGGKSARGSFVRMTGRGDAEYCAAKAVQVAPLGPGDLVVWDSRVVHCSNGAAKDLEPRHVLDARGGAASTQPSLLRLVAYVAMMPRTRATPSQIDQRKRAVARGTTAGHNPLVMRRGAVSKAFAPPDGLDPCFRLV